MESSVLHSALYSCGVSIMRRTCKHQGLATPWAEAHLVINSAMISAVDELIRQNSRITTREIVVELSISKGTVHHIIHKTLGYGKVSAQWVPKHLSDNQKTARMSVCLNQQFLYWNHPTLSTLNFI
ncbi:hypothetical protein AVEN_150627-1 [Araneus ventricosus]|uniref:Uncharacterized protein n=1 Tax=Araneus ventricosus TaxID=182803 RepID=A0A4Y2WS45_ARAVE|nr:hypothetical protein AVEN_150627-1 [Araneus ventricosus]